MKKRTRLICLVLVLSLLMAFPVHAESTVEPRGSAFFSSYLTFLHKTEENTLQIWFDVDSNAAIMDEIGVSTIEIYRSADQENWTKMRTYNKLAYPAMIDYNTSSHTGYVTYGNPTAGYYYTACVTFYAKNSTGIGERFVYTTILQM